MRSTRLTARTGLAATALTAVLALVAALLGSAPAATAASADETIFGSVVPATASVVDPHAVELGVTFVPKIAGSVTGVRFYKGVANTGTHTGSLWAADGSRLANATFAGETATGWQSVAFAAPVPVTAGTTYVASSFTPTGTSPAAGNASGAPYVSGDLTVPTNGGVSRYDTPGFPTSSYRANNYYVDLTFTPSPTASPSPTPSASPTASPTPTPTATPTSTPTPSATPTPTATPTPSATPTPTPTSPSDFKPGNLTGTVAVPAGAGPEDVSSPDHVIGDGTAASCTSAAVVSAVAGGGVITFNCGPDPKTIVLDRTLQVRNSTQKLVIDGGGKVTLSGGKTNRILYIDTCDTSLGSVPGNCLYAPDFPRVSVQNITLVDGNATNASYVSPGDSSGGANGGGAILALGGHLKVVRSVFTNNTCASTGPDLGGGAIRVLAQHSATPNDFDNSYAARNQDPALIVQSTFGGADGLGNSCSNGGAVSTLRTPATIINSLLTYNSAVGCCSNPAKAGTPGGGSGGATYSDGDSYDLTIRGTDIERNTAKAGGSAIFLVSNDNTGHLVIDSTTSKNNTYTPYLGTSQSFQNYPGIFYLGDGAPRITNSTIQ